MVWRVCMVHLKNRDDAQDILQNVLLKFAQHTRPFQSPEHEKAWVLRVAINESRDLLRDAFRSRSAPWEEVLSQQGSGGRGVPGAFAGGALPSPQVPGRGVPLLL